MVDGAGQRLMERKQRRRGQKALGEGCKIGVNRSRGKTWSYRDG